MQPKSPDLIVQEFKDEIAFDAEWLRSSLASVLCYAAELIKKETMRRIPGSVEEQMFSQEECDIFNGAIDDCKAILINEAKKITGEE